MIEQRFQEPRSYSFIQIADEEIRRFPKFIVNQVQVETILYNKSIMLTYCLIVNHPHIILQVKIGYPHT